jgi:hypothetical protein
MACANPVNQILPGRPPLTACPGEAATTHRLFLIGDAGAPELADADSGDSGDSGDWTTLVDPVLSALRDDVAASVARLGPENAVVIYLGDNVYQNGLVGPDESGRRHGERVLEAQIAAAGEARSIFLAGNHDWDIEGSNGWDHVRNQNAFLEGRPRASMLPPGGCSGPEVVDFGDHLRVVFIDPIGWDHLKTDPAVHSEACPKETDLAELWYEFADHFDRTDGRHVALALHHPLLTAGPHGGHYTWKQHLFPLTDFVSWLWIPLPIIGSIYPLSRQLGVTGTDTTNAAYIDAVIGIYQASTPRAPMLVAAGHEHSLQVHRDFLGMFYAVSGAGSASKVNRVEPMDTALMAEARPGYMRLDARADGALSLEVLATDGDPADRSLYRACLADGPPDGGRRAH